MKEMSFKSGVKCRRSDSKGGDCDEVMCAGRGNREPGGE